MNIQIYLEDYLAKQLTQYAEKFHKKRNAIIREAIKEWVVKHTERQWPESIIQFNGIEDFPDVTEIRQNVIQPTKKLFCTFTTPLFL